MNKTLVIDSNVFAKLFVKEPDSEQAEHFLDSCLNKEIKILVPSIFLYEVIYIVQKKGKDLRQV